MKTYNGWRVSSIFMLLLTYFAILRSAQIPYPFAATYMSENYYTAGSSFESNLMRVMDSLAQNTSQTGFNTSSYAVDPQYDVCGQSIYCQIWIGACYVRYANYSFVSVFEKYGGSVLESGLKSVNESKSPSVFRSTLEKLMSNLSAEVCQDGSKGFAAQSANYSTPVMEKIDAFVECSRDLSSANCGSCLEMGFESMRSIDDLQFQYIHPSCLVRYVSTEMNNGLTEPGNVGGTNWLPPDNVGGTNWGAPYNLVGTNSSS
ncbi:hypothetical protein SUGI_0653060 [Cryptomeria japonica]|nr:hypothetical protein SUGI_0653060 [Cryptomeria japonica]